MRNSRELLLIALCDAFITLLLGWLSFYRGQTNFIPLFCLYVSCLAGGGIFSWTPAQEKDDALDPAKSPEGQGRLQRFLRLLKVWSGRALPALLPWTALAVQTAALFYLGHQILFRFSFLETAPATPAFSILMAALGYYGLFARRLLEGEGSPDSRDNSEALMWQRLKASGGFLSAVASALLLIPGGRNLTVPASDLLFFAFMSYLLFLLANCSATLLARARRRDSQAPFFLALLFAGPSLAESVETTLGRHLNITFSCGQALKTFLPLAERLALVALSILWILTSVVLVQPSQKALLKRFGRVNAAALEPGLHFKLPWPLESVTLHTPSLVRHVNVGFTPDPKQKDIIWTKSHARENFNLLLDRGTQMISIDLQVLYKIRSISDYHCNWQNPLEGISAFAYRALLRDTVASTFDEIMVRDRALFTEALRKDTQNQLDRFGTGIEIVDMVILALHPPMEIAQSFEDVISSQIDRKTSVLEARSFDNYTLSLARSEASRTRTQAQGYEVSRVSAARAETQAFLDRLEGFEKAPDLVEFRLKMEKYEEILSTTRLFIVDPDLLRRNDRLILNSINSSNSSFSSGRSR